MLRKRSIAIKRALLKPRVPKTLSELLAQAFTASKQYPGIFYPDGFLLLEDGTIEYDLNYHLEESGEEDRDATDQEYDGNPSFERPFGASSSPYCCGLLEIGNFEFEGTNLNNMENSILTALMRVWMADLASAYTMIMATVVPTQQDAYKALELVDFDTAAIYKSKGTGNKITVLVKDFTDTKELPPGHINLTQREY